MKSSTHSWICCQIGAREHYAVPRALKLSDLLEEVITDLWIPPGTLMHSWKLRLDGRFHPALADARVKAPNVAALTFEMKASATGTNGWSRIIRRNDWFQQHAVKELVQSHRNSSNGNHTVFAYSYAAEHIFKFARERGWRTVLGQIDPGPVEERIVAGLRQTTAIAESDWEPAPKQYWESWRTECTLADQIVVNSNWSRQALLAEGVADEKIRVIPLAYEASTSSFEREYPAAFNPNRPLRVLFLGQINLRKGVAQLLEAAKLLVDYDIEFWLVGPTQISIPSEFKQHPRIRWFGSVPRADVAKYYKEADVFILPTLSDGFGLTQLEAQSWKLPLIVSQHCGEVICDGVNGTVLDEVTGSAIAEALKTLVRSPQILNSMSSRSCVSERFSLRTLASSLATL